MRSVSARSLVFSRRRQWFTVSNAAYRSTKTAPVTSPLWNSSSMCCMRFRSWLVVDLLGCYPACWGMMAGSATGVSLLRIRCSNCLYGWHSREIGWTLFAYAGSLLGWFWFSSRSLGCFLSACSCSSAQGPTSCQSSKLPDLLLKILSRPMALPVLRALMLILSSQSSVLGVLNSVYVLGCLVVDFPLSSNWYATNTHDTGLAVVVYCCCVGVMGRCWFFGWGFMPFCCFLPYQLSPVEFAISAGDILIGRLWVSHLGCTSLVLKLPFYKTRP